MAWLLGPMKVIPSRSHSSTKSARSATNPHPAQTASALHGHQRLLEAPVVEVGRLALPVGLVHERRRPEVVRLVGFADEPGPAVRLGEQGDGADGRAALQVEFADGVDDAHGRLATVDDGHALEVYGHDDLRIAEERRRLEIRPFYPIDLR